ncbi:MAG: ATP-binding protein [Deltaproteobacteria bacterium]|nr:ATP-binding protein [Deltaproteobacteria bacterium]MBW2359494.1 ATP-binding protein [Deltaproteobacteria bacterium]
MGRRAEFRRRLERVLALGESVLEELAGEPLPPAAFERHLAFRWESGRGPGRLVPIEEPALFDLSELVGVESAVHELVNNTEQFTRGLPCNHVLLHGERGTGKSSAVRGLLGRFGPQGLRMLEVQKADLVHLPRVLEALRGASHRFVLFCDDLSFDAGEAKYRELKAALEGSLISPPENVRIYATSNRRHLLPETMADNRGAMLDADGELHMGEAVEEKLALSDRFGLVLGFYGFDQATYLEIVERTARKLGVRAEPAALRAAALRWALRHSSRSGRTARQFVDAFVGREQLDASQS